MDKSHESMCLLALLGCCFTSWRAFGGDFLQADDAMRALGCSELVCLVFCGTEIMRVSFGETFSCPRRLSWSSCLFQAQGSQPLCMPFLLLPSVTPLPEPAPPGTSLAVPVVPSQVRHLDLGIDGEDVQTTSTMVLSWGPNFQMLP